MRKLIQQLWWRFFPPDVSIIVTLQEHRLLTVYRTWADRVHDEGNIHRTFTWEETYEEAGITPRSVYRVSTRIQDGESFLPIVLTRVEDEDASAVSYVVGSGSKKLSYCAEAIQNYFGYIPRVLYVYLKRRNPGIINVTIKRGEIPDGQKWISFKVQPGVDSHRLNWQSHTEEAYTAIGIQAKEPKLQVSTSKFPGAERLEHWLSRGNDNTYIHYASGTKLEFCSYWLTEVFNFVPDEIYYKEVTE